MKTDTQLRADVLAELAWDPAFKATDLAVIVKDGVVTLTGHLASYSERFAVEHAVRRVKDVASLRVELTVCLASDHQRSDADIALSVKQIFLSTVLVPEQRIQATVERGRITLRGEVTWEYQREAAERLVRNLPGVVGISNHIEIARKVTTSGVHQNIHTALERQADRAADRLQVDIDGSQVTLRGTVRSWAERAAAQSAAWSSPGVDAVVNHIAVVA